MRRLFVATLSLSVVACGGKIAPGFELVSDGGASADALDDGTALDADKRGPAPVPTCTGKNSECVQNPDGSYTGAAVIKCDGVSYVGPWLLLLQRQITGQFTTVQVQTVDKPGFGAIFDDRTSPAAYLTYRVCAVDAQGTRCDAAFTTTGPSGCSCVPLTCDQLRACMVSTDNGCGGTLDCGPCSDGTACNTQTHSCCPPGEEADGTGGCVCAPLRPCPSWDPGLCICHPPP